MTEPNDIESALSLYDGLQALSNLSFPKLCPTCGARYDTVDDFVSRTEALRKHSGLKEELDDDDQVIVNLFRNCVCGSTLMDEFNNRRDLSESGLKRRKIFGELLDRLVSKGVEQQVARRELLAVMNGHGSKLLKVKKGAPNPAD